MPELRVAPRRDSQWTAANHTPLSLMLWVIGGVGMLQVDVFIAERWEITVSAAASAHSVRVTGSVITFRDLGFEVLYRSHCLVWAQGCAQEGVWYGC